MKMLALILLLVGLGGCATVPPDKVAEIWEKVEAEYPGVKVEMPAIVWTDEDIYLQREGREVFCTGVYTHSANKVYLRKWWADEDTVAHEFRHAHGDMLGEKTGRLLLDRENRPTAKHENSYTAGNENINRITATAKQPAMGPPRITVSALHHPLGSNNGEAGLHRIEVTALPPDVAPER
jgi:hypothetical protein